MEPDHKSLLRDLYDEADLCRNEDVIELAELRGECMSMAMELTK